MLVPALLPPQSPPGKGSVSPSEGQVFWTPVYQGRHSSEIGTVFSFQHASKKNHDSKVLSQPGRSHLPDCAADKLLMAVAPLI